MDKKQLYYVIGGVAVIGISIGLYLYNKNKNVEGDVETADLKNKSAEEKIDGVKNETVPMLKPSPVRPRPVSSSVITATATAMPSVTKLTEQEVADRLATGCGKKPKLKRNQILYHECRRNMTERMKDKGLISFDGSYSFEGLLDNDFFSGFDSNFDLNL